MIDVKTGEDMRKWWVAFSVAYNTPSSLRKFLREIENGNGQQTVDQINGLVDTARKEGRIRE